VLIEVDFHLDPFLPWTEQLKVLTYRVRQVLEQHPEAPLARACRPQGFPPFAEGRGHFGCPQRLRRVTDQLSKMEPFCNSRRSPAARRRDGVHNPCPKSTSHNHRCHRVLRPSSAWAICSAMRASPPPTSNPTCRSTPSSAPAATGVFTETASGARSDRSVLERFLDQLRPGNTLVVWKLDRLAGRCATWSTPSPASPSAASGSAACSRRSTPLPPGGKLVFTCCRPGRVRTRPGPRAHQGRAGGRAGPGPPGRPAVGHDGLQGLGGAGDVRLWAVHGGGDRHDPWGQPRLDLPTPQQRR
jgi:Resolvase, N terminal domain